MAVMGSHKVGGIGSRCVSGHRYSGVISQEGTKGIAVGGLDAIGAELTCG